MLQYTIKALDGTQDVTIDKLWNSYEKNRSSTQEISKQGWMLIMEYIQFSGLIN